MPLKLSLRPGERFVVNGAVIENGDRRATLVLQNKASVLREKDIMQPDQATTPARRVYFPVMMLYLNSGKEEDTFADFARRLSEFTSAVRHPDIIAECVAISREVLAGEHYKALLRCRKLIAYEDERLGAAGVDQGISANRAAG